MATISIGGRSFQGEDDESIFEWIESLNTSSRAIFSEKFESYSYVIRREIESYPKGDYDSYFARKFNEKYREKFLSDESGSLKVNELYLTVIYKPFGGDIFGGLKKASLTEAKNIKVLQDEAIKELNGAINKFVLSLKSYDPSVLGIYSQVTDDGKEVFFSEPMEVMFYILNGRKGSVPITRNRLRNTIAQSQIRFSRNGEVGIATSLAGSSYIGMMELIDYDEGTWPGQLDYLLESDFEFVITNSFCPIHDSAALDLLKKQEKFMEETGDAGITQKKQLSQARDQLISKLFCMGTHHLTVKINDSDLVKLKKNLDSVAEDLSRHGIIMKQLTKALEAGFWAQFPGNRRYRPRPQPITSKNFWCFSSFHNYLTGKIEGNPWGPAITGFKTDSKTPFYLNFHESPSGKNSFGKRPPGHAGIFGKTGAGKTTLLTMILALMLKYRPNQVLFDKDQGLENYVRSVGGIYNPVTWGVKTGWNPFQMEPSALNNFFLKDFVADLAVGGTEFTLQQVDIDEISIAVDVVMSDKTPKEERNIHSLYQMLPPGSDERTSVKKLIRPWVDGDLAWVFNNKTDNLSLGKGIFGFDTTSFLQNKKIRVPILKYILHRVDKEIIDNITHTIMAFEESWYFAEDEFFQKLIKDGLKTLRKRDTIVLFSTQEPHDLLSSSIGKTFASAMSTAICLRDPSAKFEDYSNLGLSNVQVDIVRKFNEGEYKFLVKKGSVSSVASFDLAGFDDEINIFSCDASKAAVMNECINEVGNNPEVFLPVFYERMRGLI
ncbi:hypothetical protein HLB25_20860 [Dickeya dadantii]|uniref:VirB4 family type IV secretion/conjugal transfer ATPase n=2 Tax=Dickeya dadantii TaxID=204038 RepID=UPI0014959D3D|nr:hypothetical protein [Dickeya dadantii]NPE68974.1 hypothetical protein [Dickeya dadantii]